MKKETTTSQTNWKIFRWLYWLNMIVFGIVIMKELPEAYQSLGFGLSLSSVTFLPPLAVYKRDKPYTFKTFMEEHITLALIVAVLYGTPYLFGN